MSCSEATADGGPEMTVGMRGLVPRAAAAAAAVSSPSPFVLFADLARASGGAPGVPPPTRFIELLRRYGRQRVALRRDPPEGSRPGGDSAALLSGPARRVHRGHSERAGRAQTGPSAAAVVPERQCALQLL